MNLKQQRGQTSNICALSFLIAVSGCDRIEGKLKDGANSVSQGAKTAVREVLVSDLQKDAERKCIAALTAAPIKRPQQPVTGNDLLSQADALLNSVSRQFGHAASYPLNVRVLGDGKYHVAVPLFQEGDQSARLITGNCTVEGGTVTDYAVY